MEDAKKNYCNFHDTYLRQYIQQADTKASWLFAASSAVLIWITSNKDFFNYIKNENFCFISIFILTSVITMFLSCFFAFNTIRPRTKNTKQKGIIYFKNIEKYNNSTEYINDINEMHEDEIYTKRLESQYYMSLICCEKYNSLKYAINLFGVSLIICIILHSYFMFR